MKKALRLLAHSQMVPIEDTVIMEYVLQLLQPQTFCPWSLSSIQPTPSENPRAWGKASNCMCHRALGWSVVFSLPWDGVVFIFLCFSSRMEKVREWCASFSHLAETHRWWMTCNERQVNMQTARHIYLVKVLPDASTFRKEDPRDPREIISPENFWKHQQPCSKTESVTQVWQQEFGSPRPT
jgi:hypothetical protein